MEEMRQGQELNHATYGRGVVLSSDEERTVVQFHEFGRKLFVTALMTAQLVCEGTPRTLLPATAEVVKPQNNRSRRPSNSKSAGASSTSRDSRSTIAKRLGSSLERLRRSEERRFLRLNMIRAVGDRLKLLRQRRGMRKVELHRRSGVPLSSLEYYERGTRKPGIVALEKLSGVLETEVDSFLSEGPKPNSVSIGTFRAAWLEALKAALR